MAPVASSISLLSRLHGQHADLLSDIRTQKELKPDLESKLKEALDGFARSFA